jgi:hypothetical protein
MATSTGMLLQSRNSRKAAQDVAWQEALRLSNEQKAASEEQASKLASEAYVGKKQQERTLPNVMAHAGLSGQGYTETTANNIGTAYQNAWSGIMSQKQTAQRGIDSALTTTKNNINQNKAGIDADYYDALASYYASLRSSGSNSGSNGTTSGTPTATNPLIGALGDTSALNSMSLMGNAKKLFTSDKYKRAFWGAAPGFEPTIANIRAYMETVKGKGGSKLSTVELDSLMDAITKYWKQYRVNQQINPGGTIQGGAGVFTEGSTILPGGTQVPGTTPKTSGTRRLM